MEKEYFILSLNHNDSRFPSMLKDIIYKGEEYHYPFPVEGDTLESVYDSIEVLAYKTPFCMRDVVTKEAILDSSDGKNSDLSYFKAVPASRSDIIRITNKYKSMFSDDIERYKKSLENIKNISNEYYKKIKEIEEKEINDERIAKSYLINNFA